MGEINKERGKSMKESTMQELVALMNSLENEEFIIHVEFTEEANDGQK